MTAQPRTSFTGGIGSFEETMSLTELVREHEATIDRLRARIEKEAAKAADRCRKQRERAEEAEARAEALEQAGNMLASGAVQALEDGLIWRGLLEQGLRQWRQAL